MYGKAFIQYNSKDCVTQDRTEIVTKIFPRNNVSTILYFDIPFRCVAVLKVYLFRFNGIVSVEWLSTHSLKMQNQYA